MRSSTVRYGSRLPNTRSPRARDFAFDRHQTFQHTLGVGDELRVFEPGDQLGKRPAEIGRTQLEEIGRRWRALRDVQLAVEKHRRDRGRVHQVQHVAVRTAELLDLAFQLVVGAAQGGFG